MYFQATWITEHPDAELATKGFLTSVDPFMYSEAALVRKRLQTHTTDVRFLTSVHTTMSAEITTCIECLGTPFELTLEGFLTSVCSFVCCERTVC